MAGSNDTTAATIQDRLVALCPSIDLTELGLTNTPTATKDLGDCRIDPDDLPLFEVVRGIAPQHIKVDAMRFDTTRYFYIRLYTQQLCQDAATNETYRATAAACVLPVLRFFMKHYALQDANMQNPIVANAEISQDTGDRKMTQQMQDYAGVVFRMEVTTTHLY